MRAAAREPPGKENGVSHRVESAPRGSVQAQSERGLVRTFKRLEKRNEKRRVARCRPQDVRNLQSVRAGKQWRVLNP